MVVLFRQKDNGIIARRREKKKRSDLLKNRSFRHEVNVVFNKVYKKQVEALYRAVGRGK